ncbi:MAG TPA: tRNA threonylcarbamoyladenosine dehydratase [Bacteroidales bacterium]|nr:tRNA threonylcarbamoyladenosine dehydratase [Bacteroidales bacterium]HPI68810.1 tRNA threonylcarbamoyladenosine dehydratase [Bacteroidales bacterium]HPR73556.1 tRNA threonylcarbamoyladenosine dehydratase [Bacteroidales bacterium]
MVFDWLNRTEMLLGRKGMLNLSSARILIVGLGGVGAYAAEMICRAGIGSMTIVDGDRIQSSNRNRQLLALKSTEGLYKTEVMASRLLDINPGLRLEVINEYIKDDSMITVLDKGYDYVVDAIDTLSPKVYLIWHSLMRKYPIVSSMGSGGKFDPLQISISDISETSGCSLARMLRKRLHRLGIREGVTAVWSPEAYDKTRVLTVTGEQNKASVVGTISYMPAAFGLACASVVIRHLANGDHTNIIKAK